MTTDPKSSRRQLSHERILDAAARAVRKHGYTGVGVADVMKEAGLTHGGFYAHFKSRDALLAAAVEHAGNESAKCLARRMAALAERGASPVRALVEAYLGDTHVQATELGCPVAALGTEMPRQADDVREVSRERITALIGMARDALPPGSPEHHPFALASSLVGAVQLARALGEEGKAMLRATSQTLIEQYDRKV
ncbi:TetR/AcrR family transcriptional regulator [Massilia sp. GCM10020059]|uniref:TetR/AcrR family transcriptional regulator n=1 Tax=Massilia agrisoli TaxID=2892444 RepID=A0ABS8IXN4_9BURK|nr:TetR/AcrR family transcriptional regulator [Massilia agrisoli]MCC6071959.1 TetR/AcrR family transcriptional regulator [Massilia agrisoli]